MFTGIISDIGTVRRAAPADGGRDLDIGCAYTDLEPGESIAVNGACMTVAAVTPDGFACRAVRTTLERTLLGNLAPGHRVNLERALALGDRLGGHLVQGHVDGVGEVVGRVADGERTLLDLRLPDTVAAVTVLLGSITVDGVSLTVNALPAAGVAQVSLVPFTFQHTTLGERAPGEQVHLEGDLIGKYVRSLVVPHARP